MSSVILNWAACLFFLGALVAIFAMRGVIKAVGRKSYSYVATGMSMLALAALIRVFHSEGMINTSSFAGEPLFYQLTNLIIMITGLTFVVSGISSWLVVRKRLQVDSNQVVRRLETIKLIEQLTQLENRVDTILTASLELIVRDYEFLSGTVVKFSYRTGAVRMVGSVGKRMFDPANWTRARFNNQLWRTSHDEAGANVCNLLTLPAGSVPACRTISIVVDHTPVGLFLLFESPTGELTREMHQNLRLIADIIARRIELDRRQLHVQFHEETSQFRHEIERSLTHPEDIQLTVTALSAAVRDNMTADVVSLLVYHPDEAQATRYTSSAGGNLVEYKVSVPSKKTLTGYLYHARKSIVCKDTRGTVSVAIDGPLAAESIRSILAVPVVAPNGCLGALMLGSERVYEYAAHHQSLIEATAPSLAAMLRSAQSLRVTQARTRKYEQQLRLMADASVLSAGEWLSASADVLAMVTGSDCVRVSIIEDDGLFLRSVEMSSKRPVPKAVPENGLFALSMLDRHRTVIETGQPTVAVYGDADRLVSRIELTQVVGEDCDRIRILPLVARGQCVGAVSIGYAGKEFSELSSVDETFVQAVASQMALVIAVPMGVGTGRNRLGAIERRVTANRSEKDLRNRLKSPLTGILGSLEVLRSQKDTPNPERYLEIIDRSARRLKEYLEPQGTTVSR